VRILETASIRLVTEFGTCVIRRDYFLISVNRRDSGDFMDCIFCEYPECIAPFLVATF
jgi:hypothetical protein